MAMFHILGMAPLLKNLLKSNVNSVLERSFFKISFGILSIPTAFLFRAFMVTFATSPSVKSAESEESSSS